MLTSCWWVSRFAVLHRAWKRGASSSRSTVRVELVDEGRRDGRAHGRVLEQLAARPRPRGRVQHLRARPEAEDRQHAGERRGEQERLHADGPPV
jgi:hypothetical protein